MKNDTLDVGFIGLGSMGGAMAKRLMDAGFQLHMSDIDQARVDDFVSRGATAHTTPKAVADIAPIVFTCLPNAEVCRKVLLDESGLIHGRAMRVHVETSTIGPSELRGSAAILQRQGIETLDTPVSGGPSAARAGTLMVMTAGCADAHALLKPFLESISLKQKMISEKPGSAQAMKLINNLLAAANFAASFEALALGLHLGLEPEMMAEVISQSSGANTAFTPQRIAAIMSREFNSGAKFELLYKDVNLAFAEAEAVGFPVDMLTTLTAVADVWNGAKAAGLGDEDILELGSYILNRNRIG